MNVEISGWLPHTVGVSSRTEFFNATVGTNVFNDVTERGFVLDGVTTTTTGRFLFATFGLHYNIYPTFLWKNIAAENIF